MQGDAPFRMQPADFDRWYVRSDTGTMVPISAFTTAHWEYGSPELDRFNGVPAVDINGEAAHGVSSGTAMKAIEEIVAKLPPGFRVDWTGQSYQERAAGAQTPILYTMSVIIVFLALAALYESWAMPIPILMAVPLGIIGAVLATALRGLERDVYFQVGMLTTIGLASKNAILIVEFAKLNMDAGLGVIESTLHAVRDRLRPIVMTSLAFGFGVLPLALAHGAGAGAQRAIGTGIFGGMIAGTVFGVLFVPVLFVSVRRLFGAKIETHLEPPHPPNGEGAMLNFTDVAMRRGPRLLFAGATFSLFRGEKVGITGENGSGKSSLLEPGARRAARRMPAASRCPRSLVMAHVSPGTAGNRSAGDRVRAGRRSGAARDRARTCDRPPSATRARGIGELHARYAAVGGYDARSRAGRLMHGLGFDHTEMKRGRCAAFSGGWRVRLNVAQALMCRSDLLLLDEPTNHLDLDAILWLESWLRDYPGTLLLIAHDREFLDRVCNRIVNIEHGRRTPIAATTRPSRSSGPRSSPSNRPCYTRQQREIKHMESFVERFRAKASKARQAQSRLKALERMQRIAPAHVDSPLRVRFAEPFKLPRPLLALEDQSVGYEGRVLLQHIKLTLSPGRPDRTAGRNGAGKSTCMKLLAGELPALGGTRTEARDLRIGYFAQHQLEQLTANESPLENLRRVGASARRARDRAGAARLPRRLRLSRRSRV